MVAHVQEPGASDNASGCATLYALARALNESIASGALPPPERTLTFIWGDEVNASREWLRAHPDDAASVRYMFALDMTGEDTARTGGTFLIEKQADPSAVWSRPSDPHSEWGSSTVAAASLKGSLLNDLHLAVCRRRARDTRWIVRTNPYEGGSDPTVFATAWHPVAPRLALHPAGITTRTRTAWTRLTGPVKSRMSPQPWAPPHGCSRRLTTAMRE